MRNTQVAGAAESIALDGRDQPVSIRIHATLARRLHNQLITATARNMETAGLLLGAIEVHSSRPAVLIESYVPLSPGYRTGNLCLYSESSRIVLDEQLRSGTGGWRAVGFYRSTLRGESALSDEDARLMREHFEAPGSVFLLLEGSHRRAVGSFFTLDDDGHLARPCYYLPLDSREPAETRVLPPPEEYEFSADALPEPVYARGGRRLPDLSRRLATLLRCLAAIAVVALAVLQFRTSALLDAQRQAANQRLPSSAFDLKADRIGSQWRLTWNRDAGSIRAAARGHLSIVDGVFPKEVELSQADLQTGSIVYSPLADDIRFRLETYDPESARTTSESIRVLGNPWQPSGLSSGYLDRMPDAQRVRRIPERIGTAKPAPSVGRQPFVPPGAPEPADSPPARQSLPSPPALDAKTDAIGGTPAAPAQSAAFADIAEPPPPVPEKPAPAQVITTQVVEPVLIRQVEPVYPAQASLMRVSGVVKVQATIGKDGRMHDPRAVSGPQALRAAAVDAVRSWLYKPRLLNGDPVESPIEIEIRFKLKGR